MVVEVTGEVTIARDPRDVFAFVADAENNPRWQQGMRACRWTSPPPVGVGSTYRQEAAFLGRTIESLFEVTAFEPDHRITFTTIESTFPITVTRTVEEVAGGALVRAEVRGEPAGVFRVAGPLLRRMVQRSVRGDYARLRELLESSEGA